jgi:septal ring factor EnvC (AmiA/AmiB activator)
VRERTGLAVAEVGAQISRAREQVAALEHAREALEPTHRALAHTFETAWTELTRTPGASIPPALSPRLVEALNIAARAASAWLAHTGDVEDVASHAAQTLAHAESLEARRNELRDHLARHETHLVALRAQLDAELAALQREEHALDARLCAMIRASLEPLRARFDLAPMLAAVDASLTEHAPTHDAPTMIAMPAVQLPARPQS